jgi:hypothetical protein
MGILKRKNNRIIIDEEFEAISCARTQKKTQETYGCDKPPNWTNNVGLIKGTFGIMSERPKDLTNCLIVRVYSSLLSLAIKKCVYMSFSIGYNFPFRI